MLGEHVMKLDPRMLIQFAIIAEEGSFTNAAKRLNVAQPWLSTRLHKFEVQLGFPLLIRNTRSLRLTERGEILLQSATALQENLEISEMLAEQLRRQTDFRLRIGAPPYSNKIKQRKRIVDIFSCLNEEIDIEIDVGWTPALIEKVRSGYYDIAFALGCIHEEDIDSLVICQPKIDIFMFRDNPLAINEMISPSDLKGYNVSVFTRTLNPILYDELFEPLINGGAILQQIPEVSESNVRKIISSNHCVIAEFIFSDELLNDHNMVRRTIDIKTNFSIIKNKNSRSALVNKLWNIALQESF